MSVLRQYRVIDLALVTENLMNVLYTSEWKQDLKSTHSDEFLFKKIENMHNRIMQDSEINTYPKGNSKLFDIANRLSVIQTSLTGETFDIPQQISIRILINKTNELIGLLSAESREFCIIC